MSNWARKRFIAIDWFEASKLPPQNLYTGNVFIDGKYIPFYKLKKIFQTINVSSMTNAENLLRISNRLQKIKRWEKKNYLLKEFQHLKWIWRFEQVIFHSMMSICYIDTYLLKTVLRIIDTETYRSFISFEIKKRTIWIVQDLRSNTIRIVPALKPYDWWAEWTTPAPPSAFKLSFILVIIFHPHHIVLIRFVSFHTEN